MEKQADKKPWGYPESFFVAFEIMLLGFIVEIFLKGRGLKTPQFPYNLPIVSITVVLLVLIHLRYRHRALIQWLSSIPCSVSAISTYSLLVLLLAFIPQQQESSRWLQIAGLTHLKNSWPFLFVQLYLLISLGLVVLRRGIPFKFRNLGFLLNHLGLWLTLIAAALGSGDLKRVTINLHEGRDFNSDGSLPDQSRFQIPFGIRLIDFNMDLYNSKIAVADRFSGDIVQKHGETLPVISKDFKNKISGWQITVKDYLSFAVETDSGYEPSDQPGSMTAAFVEAFDPVSGDTVSGWITSGSLVFEPRYLDLNRSRMLVLTEPEPKRFESTMVIRDNRTVADTVKLEVNKPRRFGRWKLYQVGYDAQMGKYSTLSVIEAVKDPWLPLVYAGIFMLLTGSVYLFWQGSRIRNE